MIRKLLTGSLPFLIKMLGVGSQLLTILVLIELLGATEFGAYAAAVSLGIIIAIVTDLGFTRYSFRLANRGVALRPMLARSLALRLTGSTLALIVLAPITSFFGASLLAIAFAILSSIASQLANFHRYAAIASDRPRQSIAIEITGPMLYLVAMLCIAAVEKLFPAVGEVTATTALAAYAFSYMAALVIWAHLLKVRGEWADAIVTLRRQRPPVASIRRTLLRSFPVGAEQFTSSLWYNMPVLLASVFGTALDQAVCGLFQRVWNVSIAVVSTALVSDIRRYFQKSRPIPAELRSIGAHMAVLFVLSLMGWLVYWFAYNRLLAPFAADSEMLRLLPSVMSAPLALCLAIALLVGYMRLSFLALGHDERVLRSVASAFGAVILVFTVMVLEQFPAAGRISFLEKCLVGMVIGHAIAGTVLLLRLMRRSRAGGGRDASVERRWKLVLAHIYADDNKGDLGIIEATVDTFRLDSARRGQALHVTALSMFNRAAVNDSHPHRLLRSSVDRIVPASVSQRYVEPRGALRSLQKSVTIPLQILASLARIALWRLTGRRAAWLLDEGERAIAEADLLCCKGGSLLYCDRSLRGHFFMLRLLFPLIQAELMGRPAIVLGQSVGPFKTSLAGRLAAAVFNRSDGIYVREQVSYAELMRIGVRGDRALIIPDVAFCHVRHPPPAGFVAGALGVTARQTSRDPAAQAAFEDRLVSILDAYLTQDTGRSVRFLPQVVGPDASQDDRLVLARLHERLSQLHGERTTLDTRDLTPGELLSIYGEVEALLGTRLHSTIFAATMGTPAIALEYQQTKAGGTFALLGVPENVLSWQSSADAIGGALNRVLADRERLSARLRGRCIEMCDEISTAVECIVSRSGSLAAKEEFA